MEEQTWKSYMPYGDLSIFLLFLLVFSLHICFTFSYSVALGYSVLFFFFPLFVFFAFQLSTILLIYSLAQIFFPHPFQCTNRPIKSIPYFSYSVFISGLSILFPWSVFLPLCQYHTVFFFVCFLFCFFFSVVLVPFIKGPIPSLWT